MWRVSVGTGLASSLLVIGHWAMLSSAQVFLLHYAANWEDLQYPFTRFADPNCIGDIHDGAVIKALMQPGKFLSIPENTGFLLNTDGVPVFKSSKCTLWPVYLAISSLPPYIRMNSDYILLAGVWSGPIKPDIAQLLAPILANIRQLNSKGIAVQTPDGVKRVRAKLLLGLFDAPAKAVATNMKQYNGKYGCTYCTDEGTKIRRNTRVYLPDAPHNLRTAQQVMRWAQRAEESGSAVYGVKGVSILSQDIQLPECIPIDYMHAILEGVFKRLMGCWFNSSNHGKPYYIGRHVEAVNRMVARVKPPCEFRRTPRPIEVMSYWKASEFRSWLLYFAIPILKSFLPPEYIHHLALLVCAVHILLSDSVSSAKLDTADRLLKTFYNLVPHFYPLDECTSNMHSLVHMVPFVRLWGPLWAHSMFGFENMNGILKTTFHGTRKVVDQLVFNVTLKQTLPFILKQKQPLPSTTSDRHQLGDHLYAVGRIHNHKLSQEEKIALTNCSGRTTPIGTTVPVVGRLMKNHTLYHSLLHQRGAARNNSLCMFETAEEQGFAVIDYFCFLLSSQLLAILQALE